MSQARFSPSRKGLKVRTACAACPAFDKGRGSCRKPRAQAETCVERQIKALRKQLA